MCRRQSSWSPWQYPPRLSAQTIRTIDAPGAGTGPGQGTNALDINASGTIIGFSRDANDVRHGFVRSRNGRFTIFDAPGAGTAPGQGTRAYSVNPSGTITGFFTDSANVAHGYVRSNQGVITVIDAPGAGTGPGQGTFPFNSPQLINPNGAITGYYTDSASRFTVSCAMRMALSRRLTHRVQAQQPARARKVSQSAQMERSQASTLTRPLRRMAS